MRKIKFRGKRIDNGEWVYGYYVKYEHMGVIKHIIVTNWAQVYVNSFEVRHETIGQFTGLKDKNGKEIYEGDVLCYKDENYEDGIIGWEVFYEDGSFMASLTDGKDTFGGDFQLQEYAISDKLYCEIIGNIHNRKVEK